MAWCGRTEAATAWTRSSGAPASAPPWSTWCRSGVLESDGRIAVQGSRSLRESRLWLVGYGDWTGMASATLAGVTRAARSAVQEVQDALTDAPPTNAD
jgi:putative flavoprotein involved in K+ transport